MFHPGVFSIQLKNQGKFHLLHPLPARDCHLKKKSGKEQKRKNNNAKKIGNTCSHQLRITIDINNQF